MFQCGITEIKMYIFTYEIPQISVLLKYSYLMHNLLIANIPFIIPIFLTVSLATL